MSSAPLDLFFPPVRAWFREACGTPTPPQEQGWPVIRRGDHTLILSPTGSGKTLAAFLCEIDLLYRELMGEDDGGRTTDDGWDTSNVKRETSNVKRETSNVNPKSQIQNPRSEGVRLVYISPLKALNNDVERNLRKPLEGIRAAARHMGQQLPPLRVAVRTGDTPASDRAAMLKHPPHILITTPESLYLMLTSPKARELFRTTRTVIVDEIHTLCGNKRGVHLSLSLERLCHLADGPVQRIGLSATQKPLDEVARFLGGQQEVLTTDYADYADYTDYAHDAEAKEDISDASDASVASVASVVKMVPRPVTIIEAGYKKPLDLHVVTVVDSFENLPGETIWPSVIPNVLNDIRRHRSTLVFANNRRLAERTADRLNAQLEAEQSEEIEPGSTEALAPGGVPRDRGMFAIGAKGPIKAHHGSTSKEARHQMEEDLKAGKLPALIGTSSLELGIDIGAVDMVVQLQSPKSVAQGLQRVGRSGHLVGQTSHGRIYATFREDLVEAAAIARGMLDGDVEPTYTPLHPLDVLAQQIVAMVSVEDWCVDDVYELVRRAYAYRSLSRNAFEGVLGMLSGKYQHRDDRRDDQRDDVDLEQMGESVKAAVEERLPGLRARITWDRINNRLSALPGSRLLAMTNGGTIPDSGAFGVYLADGKTKLGELDEEFIFETRPGDTFLLGSQVWRVQEMDEQRIIVGDAAGATPRMPFWHGDYPWRPYELGSRIGRFRAALAERVQMSERSDRSERSDLLAVEQWLQRDYALDEKSARNLVIYARQQLDAIGVMSSDTTIVIESFQDAVGEAHMVIHSPFGGRINGAWALAISSAVRDNIGIEVDTLTNDDGILLHFPRTTRTGLKMLTGEELIRGMTPREAHERILRELPDSAVFGAHFRMNAARALLLPRARGGKRTPFWLQRLKARDLLAAVRRFDDFPIVAETYRDCLRDVFDMPHLEELLQRIQDGEVRIVAVDTLAPSPVAAGLLYNFASKYVYEWDAPKAERQLQELAVRRDLLDDVLKGVELSDLLKPEAITETQQQAQHAASGYQARSAEELFVILEELGDLSLDEVMARSTGEGKAWLAQLAGQGRVIEMPIPARAGAQSRWVLAEYAGEYQTAFAPSSQTSEGRAAAAEAILRRLFSFSGPLTRTAILDRYAFDEAWLDAALDRLVETRVIAHGRFTQGVEEDEYCDRRNLERIHRRTLTILRKAVQPVPLQAYAEFLARWQNAKPDERLVGRAGLREALGQLRGVALPGAVWERDALPLRLRDYKPADLDALCESGELVWVGSGRDPRRARLRFFARGEGQLFAGPADESSLTDAARAVYEFLKAEGASFVSDLQAGLKLDARACEEALTELAMAGLVTNDSLGALRSMLAGESIDNARSPRPPDSVLEAELAERMERLGRSGPAQRSSSLRPSSARMREAHRRVTDRLRGDPQPSRWSGRWSLVHRPGVMGAGVSEEERGGNLARAYLRRYGVLTRECLEREDAATDWSQLYPVLQRMEMRGEVRRGYFVMGLSGLQFALPEAVEKLRDSADSADDAIIVVNAVDPLNLYGGEIVDGPVAQTGEPLRYARLPSTYGMLWRGQPVLVAEDGGERFTGLRGAEPVIMKRALQAYLARPQSVRHVLVTQWNGQPVHATEGGKLLQELGFYRVPSGLEWWRPV